MTDDEAALLRMIRDNPDDDMPRLVYADWLEEHDQEERAWFIRSQCGNHGYRKNEFYKDEMIVGWHRGFIDEVGCTMAEWLKHGPATCAQHPVRKVMISDKDPAHSVRYYWFAIPIYENESAALPAEILPRGSELHYDATGDGFSAQNEAMSWLSRRCIEWANSQALTHA